MAPIQPLALEPPYAVDVALKSKNKIIIKKKMWYIYTMEYYSAIKKNKIMPFASPWMELETLILNELSQKEKSSRHGSVVNESD